MKKGVTIENDPKMVTEFSPRISFCFQTQRKFLKLLGARSQHHNVNLLVSFLQPPQVNLHISYFLIFLYKCRHFLLDYMFYRSLKVPIFFM